MNLVLVVRVLLHSKTVVRRLRHAHPHVQAMLADSYASELRSYDRATKFDTRTAAAVAGLSAALESTTLVNPWREFDHCAIHWQ